MCGICGFSGKKDEIILKRMADRIVHRGPDEDGFYSDGAASLAIRRLSIIDVASGHQPIHNEDSTLWTVFNGEIYNFQELRKDLEAKGHTFYTDHSDTEVIVHLYEEYGREFVHKINGMFGIALWDRKAETLFLYRDRMGVKPLFYSVVGGTLIFGSEIKAILEHPSCPRVPDLEALYHYFTFKNIPSPLTAFKGISSLRPGEMLEFERGRTVCSVWWKVVYHEDEHLDEAYAQEKIRSLLEDATRIRMISDVPIGAYLSGGVDSSTVVAFMSRFSARPVKTFALGYEDELKHKEADLFYARKVSEAFGTEHHEYIMSSSELVGDIDKVIAAFDQPFSGTISTFFLSKLIRKHVVVALSGDGSDEIFGSYLSHRLAQPMYHYARLHQKAAAGTLSDQEKTLFAPVEMSFLKDLYARSGGGEAAWRYFLYPFGDEEKQKFLSTSFREQARGVSSRVMIEEAFNSLTSHDPLNRILEMECHTQFPDQVLAFVDFLSMAHSIEVRSPFLDYRLVEFAATIPGSLKIRNGNVKDILKRSVEGLLPEGITKRPKEGFVLPIFDWMMESLQEYCRDMLSPERLKKHGLLNPSTVMELMNAYFAGNKNNAGKIWNLMMFQVWWERYFA